MNINFLPQKIKSALKEKFADKFPISVARMSGALDGGTGEGYLIGYDDKILIFSRNAGENEFKVIEAGRGLFSGRIRKEGFNILLDTEIGGQKYSIKFFPGEEKDLNSITDRLFLKNDNLEAKGDEKKSEHVEEKVEGSIDSENVIDNQSTNDEDLNPLVLLAAGMMYIAKADQSIVKEEDFYIVSLLNYDKQILSEGLKYFKEKSFEDFIEDCRKFNRERKLCILANLLEVGMKDGALSGVEQKMINSYVKGTAIDYSEFETIRQVLIIKNKISVMS